jgi:hypothetical protein
MSNNMIDKTRDRIIMSFRACQHALGAEHGGDDTVIVVGADANSLAAAQVPWPAGPNTPIALQSIGAGAENAIRIDC